MQVACPSCSSEYPVNERRLPASGLKMRCPKCGARFHVHPDGRTEGDAGGKPKEAPTKPMMPAQPAPDLELDLPAPKQAAAPARKPLVPPVGDLELDLPAPKQVKPVAKPVAPPPASAPPATKPIAPPAASAPPAMVARPKIAPPPELELDLPQPKATAKPAAPARPKIAPPVDPDLDLPAPKTPPPARPAAPAAKSAAKPAAPFDLDLDLPAPKQAKAKAAPDLDLDLPTPRQAKPQARSGAVEFEMPAKGAAPLPDLELDLPTPRHAKAAPPAKAAEVDLPSPKLGAKRPDMDLDLDVRVKPAAKPALASGGNPFEDLDRPAPQPERKKGLIEQAEEAFGDLDLPMPSTGGNDFGELEVDLPVRSKGADLPMPSKGVDLPMPKGDFTDLPVSRAGANLPALKDDGFGVDLPTPRGISDYPKARVESVDLPIAKSGADLPVAKSDDAFGDLDLPEPRALPRSGGAPGQLGGGDDMEFADLPQGSGAAVDVALPRAERPRTAPAAEKAKKSRAVYVVGAVLVVLLGAGAALHFTPYGMFGIYFFDRFMPGAGDPAAVARTIRAAEEQARSDRWIDLRESLRTFGTARRSAGLNRELLARSLVHESLYLARFDDDPRRSTRATGIRHRLDERRAEGPEMALAFAADALRQGNTGGAQRFLAQARRHAPNDPYVDLVAGEIALARGEAADAEQAFARAAEHGAGARGRWGVARARMATEGADVRSAVDAVLHESPNHEGALMASANLLAAAGQHDEANAIVDRLVGRALVGGERLRVAPTIRSEAWTTIGRREEADGRLTAALAAYDRALAARDANILALLGAGRVLLVDRPTEALARFESVLSADGANEVTLESGRTAADEANLGAARAMLAQGRASEAKTALERLASTRQDDAEVLVWLGQSERRTDPPNLEAAQQHFREAIDAAPTSFAAYVALAELFFEMERASDAAAVLEQAAARVPESAELHLGLGNFELRRNRLPEAIHEISRALEMDSDLPAAHFALGVAYRRSGELDRADETFRHLARIDPAHPRLALERGLLFEARGDSAEAVASYEAALRESPDDVDLQLRLGAAQVAAGQIEEAEETLERVRQARPSSPEAQHFMGRVAFARGRYAEALTYYRQAVRLDPQRGEFHMHAGWAALEAGQLGAALEAVEAAIERDPSLGEAYWIRGVVKLRSGHPSDAVPDLQRALVLRPNLHRAYAALGEAYDQLGRLNEAVAAYETAVERDDDVGEWWYRLGRLRLDRGDRTNALTALARATLFGDASTPLPGWLPDAHRLQADALRLGGARDEAVVHYLRYLELAPAGAIDRQDVRETLIDLGHAPPE